MKAAGIDACSRAFTDAVARHRYVSFSVLFVVMYAAMRFYQFQEGLGLLWYYDGIEQQYPFFIAEGRWLRELGANVLSGQFVIPQWTMATGYGADYIDVLTVTFGNPFNLASVFANGANAELLLTIVATAQLYVAGVVFLWYCKYRDLDPFASVVGATVYVFSGYSVLIFSQLFMLYPLVLAPLALMGVDKVFAGESPLLFVVSMALFGLYGITTTYAACLLLLVYCVIRYFLLDEPASLLGFLKWFGRIAGLIALGLLIACILLVPSVYTLMGQGRLGLERPHDLFYAYWYYVCSFTGLLYPVAIGADCFYGFAPIALFCVIAVFATWRKGDKELLALGLMIAFMAVVVCLPPLGRVFNGFAYPNNRWVWGLSLATAIAVAQVLPRLELLGERRRLALVAVAAVFAAAELLMLLFVNFTWYLVTGLSVFGAVVLAFLLLGKKSVHAWRAVALASAPLWCILLFAFWWVEWPSLDAEWNEAYRQLQEHNPAYVAMGGTYDSGADYHYDGFRFEDRKNACLAIGIPGSSYYSSYYNGFIDEYHTELGLTSSNINFGYLGFDGRTSLEALAGVKYYFVADGGEAFVPALYWHDVGSFELGAKRFTEHETESALPLVVRYDQAVSAESYLGLSMLERQEALVQGMVVAGGEADASLLDYGMLTEADWSGGFSPDGGTLSFSGPNQTVTVNAEIPAGRVAYVEIKGLKNTGYPEPGRVAFEVGFNAEGVSNLIYEYNPPSHMFSGKDSWVVNLGKVDYERHSIEATFSYLGEYEYDSFRVVLEDDTRTAELVDKLSRSADADVRYSGNTLSGWIDAGDEGGYYYIRVPYAPGWSATVDGVPVTIERANTAFMAVWLDAGRHDIYLEYSTPGLGLGALLSLVGLAGTVALAVIRRRRASNSDR